MADLRAGPGGQPRSRRTRRPPRGASGSSRAAARGRRRAGRRRRRCPGRTSGRRPRRARTAGRSPRSVDGRRDRRPAEAGGALVGLGERPAGQEDGRDRQLVGREAAEVVGEEGGLLGGPGGRREALGELAPATHGGDGIPCPRWCTKPWFPEALIGSRVVLRRHVAGEPRRVPALVRRPRDRPAGALPGDADAARGDRALLRGAGRRHRTRWRWPSTSRRPTGSIGTCAFSQLDGDNGSALYHITIGEKDAWGQGYGTEATQLMLDHAFGTLGLHRIALYVFEFNERAIRAYQRCGFVVEGRVARVDLARRPLVGRAGDERPRVGLAGATRRRGARRCRGDATARRGRAGRRRGRRGGAVAPDLRAVAMTTAGRRRRTRPGPRSAS